MYGLKIDNNNHIRLIFLFYKKKKKLFHYLFNSRDRVSYL